MEKEANSRDRPARENYCQLMRHEPAGSAREPPEKPVCTEYPECEGCPYPSHGFVCWRERCMRKETERIQRRNAKRAYGFRNSNNLPTAFQNCMKIISLFGQQSMQELAYQ